MQLSTHCAREPTGLLCAQFRSAMKRLNLPRQPFILASFALLLIQLSAPAQPTNAARSIEELRAQIEQHVTDPRFNAALWGIRIESLDTGKTLFEHHADRLMSPASNSKLYAGALALDRLGGNYRIVTPVLATAQPDRRGKLKGDVIVSGRGDPSWKLRAGSTNFLEVFDPFIAVLTNARVRRITGNIVADATFFKGPPSGGSWTVDDLENSEGAEISALTLLDNMTELRSSPGDKVGSPCSVTLAQPHTGLTLVNHTKTTANGGPRHIEARRVFGENALHIFGELPVGGTNEFTDVPVPRPAQWFANGLKAALVQHGIRVDGKARSVRWPEPSPVGSDNFKLGEVSSPPLRDLVKAFMKPSQNLETDLIFDHVGETSRSAATPAWRTSEDLAVRALEDLLRTNNLPVADLQFDEGSGLSRNNLTTANVTVGLLKLMAAHSGSNDFINALPIAGVDGTIRRRMKGTPAENNVRAKTGTLRWVNALSGYVTSAAGERLVFSLFLNRKVAAPTRNNREELDAIAVMLARFAGRSDTTLESFYAPQGTLIVTQLVNAPFPHPARANGRVYKDQFFTAADHYSDSTVAMFVPKGFRETDAVDFVFHFHGWGNSVAGTLGQFQVIEQFVASGKNAILIVPEGPHHASDSFGGKLEDADGFKRFMDEVMTTLRARGVLANKDSALGSVVLAGHSGGYHVMAGIADRGGLPANVKEIWLFDALYGETEKFLAWQKQQNGRLLNIYTDGGGTTNETARAMRLLDEAGTKFLATEYAAIKSDELQSNRVVFLHTDMTHNEVFAKRGTFGQFLKTSGLQNK
jgi:D-alanyl-D-alanine carboxypeptidase/D-alanyl-D-alanine-endopeptidase (penicillin-binding protein 4)